MHRRNHSRQPRPRAAHAGFTLIELMIALAITSILAAVTYPSFMGQIRKARRADAVDFASRVQQLQERHRATNPTYAASLSALGVASSTSSGGLYTLATSAGAGAAAATAYTITASAVTGKSQAADSGCTTLTISAAAGALSYTPASCWGR